MKEETACICHLRTTKHPRVACVSYAKDQVAIIETKTKYIERRHQIVPTHHLSYVAQTRTEHIHNTIVHPSVFQSRKTGRGNFNFTRKEREVFSNAASWTNLLYIICTVSVIRNNWLKHVTGVSARRLLLHRSALNTRLPCVYHALLFHLNTLTSDRLPRMGQN